MRSEGGQERWKDPRRFDHKPSDPNNLQLTLAMVTISSGRLGFSFKLFVETGDLHVEGGANLTSTLQPL